MRDWEDAIQTGKNQKAKIAFNARTRGLCAEVSAWKYAIFKIPI